MMITVESLLEDLYSNLYNWNITSDWENRFITNVRNKINEGMALTTEQAKSCLRLIQKYKTNLEQHIPQHIIEQILNCPRYRMDLIPSVRIPKEVRYVGHDLLGYRAKLSPEMRAMIKIVFKNDFCEYNRILLIRVTKENLQNHINFIRQNNFCFDDSTLWFLTECENRKNNQSIVGCDDNIIVAEVVGNSILSWWFENILGAEII